MGYEDAPREEHKVTCAECGVETTVPFKPDGRRPVTCRDCFQKNRPARRDGGRGGRDDRGPREEFEVTCGDCGAETTVPFKPTGSRPVLCRDCFSKNRPPRGNDRGGRDDRGPRDRVEHEVTCADCGKQTTVPFKPTGSRPVLCRDCFRK